MTPALPEDGAEWAALALSLLAALALFLRKSPFTRLGRTPFRIICASVAVLLSAVYVALYLRGGPRIVDATTYFLEGRAFSEGRFVWDVGDVPASTMGRFIVRDSLGSGAHATGIFPPGYPIVLALGFLAHAPMAVGPLLAGLLVLSTFDLAEEAARGLELSDEDRTLVPRIAALLSVICATLRYHTADTMSHGLSALCLTAALTFAYRIRNAPDSTAQSRSAASSTRRRDIATLLGLGLALGWLTATRPVSGLAGILVCALVLGRRLVSLRAVATIALGAAPPLALLALEQHAATGAWLTSSQSLYYSASDGPNGCFAYGFGPSVGCRIEHGDFVAHNLPHGYDLRAAIFTTLRRLKMHLGDALNAWPLAIVLFGGIVAAARHARSRPLALSLPIFAFAYAPFYFDGNYPGGGARFFADQLPVELVVIALVAPAAAHLVERWVRVVSPRRALFVVGASKLGLAFFALSAAGFAFFGGHEHALLRDREGGYPMFDPALLRAKGIASGLVFVDTDHGFSLGFDPNASPSTGIFVARLRNDLHDRWLWEAHQKPPAYRYVYSFDVHAKERVDVIPFEPPDSGWLEAESLWPPSSQRGGYVVPESHGCASNGRWLRFVRDPVLGGPGARLSLPTGVGGTRLAPRIALRDGQTMHSTLDLQLQSPHGTIHEWIGRRGAGVFVCDDAEVIDLEPVDVPAGEGPYSLVIGSKDPDPGDANAPNDLGVIALDALRIEEKR